jgi:hypothetical protein
MQQHWLAGFIWVLGLSYIGLQAWLLDNFSPKILIYRPPQAVEAAALWIKYTRNLRPFGHLID